MHEEKNKHELQRQEKEDGGNVFLKNLKIREMVYLFLFK